jgi:uncharacterized protein (TIGR04562 family)
VSLDLRFQWESLVAIIGGRSALDVPQLRLRSEREAEEFLDCYGFDYQRPAHRAELESFRQHALEFVQDGLLQDEPGLAVPDDVVGCRDVRQLLLWASGDRHDPRQRWTCALVRVMHTVAHSDSYFNQRFGSEIRTQVLGRFEKHLHQTERGLELGTDPAAIPLVTFEVKHAKSLRSVLMKLLHKPENVATDIFDRLGVRFVTRYRFDAIRVVRYLRQRNVVMFANVKPSRSRNTLIDLEWLREEFERLRDEPTLTDTDLLHLLREHVQHRPLLPGDTAFNQHSSIGYHAIQFTCRQLVRVPNPFRPAPEPDPEAPSDPDDLCFFYPFEVQVMDEESYEESRSGLAAHDIYKQRQREAVKQRVLGPLLDR